MKAAAAVLGASLLFFVGVLTGAGRREAVPPPAAIPLGATNQSSSGSAPPSSPAGPDGAPLRTTTTTARTGATAPTAGTTPTGPTGVTPTTAPTASSTASSTTTSTGAGQVQQVDNQVDCAAGKRGRGKREPCPSPTTASTRETPGGGRNG